MSERIEADVAIVGSGPGGATLAWALRDSGARVVLLERGGFLPSEEENWSPAAVFGEGRYKTSEVWRDADGRAFRPGMHYWVGGNTKVYGAALPRMRREDFDEYRHEDGVSPAWPISYDDLEPYYEQAERLYRAHGVAPSEDPTEPAHLNGYPFPPVPDAPPIAALRERLRAQGLHPYTLPIGIDLRPGGACQFCGTCDGYVCRVHAKSDADVCCVRPAMERPNVTVRTGAYVQRLGTSPDGERVVEAHGVDADGPFVVSAKTFVVSCGAVNSAALLLRSANAAHPHGLANGSDQLGRNYMHHVHSGVMGLRARRNATVFQKTMAVNDWYRGDGEWPYPMGTLWLINKAAGEMLRAVEPRLPRRLAGAVAARSVDWWACSEDLPSPDRRVTLDPDGTIRLSWRPSNLGSHRRLVAAGRRMLRRAGYPVVVTRRMGVEFAAHQCGTARSGADPSTSVLDPLCRTHDVENLYVVDASFFPSSAVLNPVLTIAAQALRVADRALLRG